MEIRQTNDPFKLSVKNDYYKATIIYDDDYENGLKTNFNKDKMIITVITLKTGYPKINCAYNIDGKSDNISAENCSTDKIAIAMETLNAIREQFFKYFPKNKL